MKKIIFITAILLLANVVIKAQITKVLYFKADLACCMAKACNNLQNDISTIISVNFDKSVSFEVIKISEQNNADLVSKYSAKSQTVIIEKYDKKGKLVEYADISSQVKTFAYNNDKVAFTQILKNKIQ